MYVWLYVFLGRCLYTMVIRSITIYENRMPPPMHVQSISKFIRTLPL